MVGEKIVEQRWYNFYTKKSGRDWAAVCPSPLLWESHRRGRRGQEKRQTATGIGGEVKERNQLDLSSAPKLSSQTQRDPIPQSCQIQTGHTSEARRNGWLLPNITLNN